MRIYSGHDVYGQLNKSLRSVTALPKASMPSLIWDFMLTAAGDLGPFGVLLWSYLKRKARTTTSGPAGRTVWRCDKTSRADVEVYRRLQRPRRGIVCWTAFTSASLTQNVAEDRFGRRASGADSVTFKIKTRAACIKDDSVFESEDEVLLPPMTCLYVEEVTGVGRAVKIFLTDVLCDVGGRDW
jgi:hypothetical protein